MKNIIFTTLLALMLFTLSACSTTENFIDDEEVRFICENKSAAKNEKNIRQQDECIKLVASKIADEKNKTTGTAWSVFVGYIMAGFILLLAG